MQGAPKGGAFDALKRGRRFCSSPFSFSIAKKTADSLAASVLLSSPRRESLARELVTTDLRLIAGREPAERARCIFVSWRKRFFFASLSSEREEWRGKRRRSSKFSRRNEKKKNKKIPARLQRSLPPVARSFLFPPLLLCFPPKSRVLYPPLCARK